MLVFISGPYSGEHQLEHQRIAKEMAERLWQLGHSVICPHLNSGGMDHVASYQTYIDGYLQILARCDAVVLLPNWENSSGANTEVAYAKKLNIPIFFHSNLPSLHPTEVKCPNQVKRFAEILGDIYRIHLSKNHDYSPANVLGTSDIGVATREWDKVARLMNLSGYDIQLTKSVFCDSPKANILGLIWLSMISILRTFGFNLVIKAINKKPPRDPKHESIIDTYKDLTCYGIIAQLLAEDNWGR